MYIVYQDTVNESMKECQNLFVIKKRDRTYAVGSNGISSKYIQQDNS